MSLHVHLVHHDMYRWQKPSAISEITPHWITCISTQVTGIIIADKLYYDKIIMYSQSLLLILCIHDMMHVLHRHLLNELCMPSQSFSSSCNEANTWDLLSEVNSSDSKTRIPHGHIPAKIPASVKAMKCVIYWIFYSIWGWWTQYGLYIWNFWSILTIRARPQHFLLWNFKWTINVAKSWQRARPWYETSSKYN